MLDKVSTAVDSGNEMLDTQIPSAMTKQGATVISHMNMLQRVLAHDNSKHLNTVLGNMELMACAITWFCSVSMNNVLSPCSDISSESTETGGQQYQLGIRTSMVTSWSFHKEVYSNIYV
jgi:hypothetical protein